MNDEDNKEMIKGEAGKEVVGVTEGLTHLDEVQKSALNEDQKASIVAEAIRNGEKVIEIDGHLFTRALYHDLGRELGAEQSEEILDKAFDAAPAWDAEPEPVETRAAPMTDEQIKAAVEPKPLGEEFVATDPGVPFGLRPASDEAKTEVLANTSAFREEVNYAILTVAGPTGRAVTKMVTLGGQNDAAAITKAFADALHESSFGPR